VSDDDDLPDQLAALGAAIARAEPRTLEEVETITQVAMRLSLLIEMLIGRGVLRQNDARILGLYGQSAARPRVRLSVIRDKHAVASPPIDCAAHFHLCRGRCCSFHVALDPVEVRQGRLRFDLDEPYLLERAADGYCSHMRAGDGGCEAYDDRPATCRDYDCRHDPRVWIDYPQRIPAPMPEGVVPRF